MGRKLIPGLDKIDEDWVKKEVKLLLKPWLHQLHWWMPPAGMYGVSGQHDFLIVQNHRFWSIETKAGKNKPTDNQIDFANGVAKGGGISLCINEWNLAEVSFVAEYVGLHGVLPGGHNFETYRKKVKVAKA